ncbi:MAG: NADH dehydrogenase subunit 4 [Pseudobutyrivibrio sp.]|nr:NADH dehydrogenase subunit 4 [Pseudobutyrivibrio sp.]
MQSKKSFFNRALFKKNISRTWIIGLLYLILLLLMQPVQLVINMANFDTAYYYQPGYTKAMLIYELLSNTSVGLITCIVAIVVTGITFWYLFFKRDSYMIHAFPVSRKSLFFTGLASSAVITICPLIINAVVLTIVSAAEKAYAFDGIWYWTLIATVSTLLFLSISVFSLMTSGQVATAVIFYFIFNFLYALMEIAFRLTASMLLFGMNDSLSGFQINPLTPSLFIDGNGYGKVNLAFQTLYNEMGDLKSYTVAFNGSKYLVIYAIAAVVITAIAYVLYVFKKNETVHDFISVPWLKPVFTVGMSFFISMVAGAAVASMVDAVKYQTYSSRFAIAIISMLIIGAILFYATQMLIEKTLRVFSAKKFGFMVGYSVAALAFMICLRNDVFNVEDKVPAADEIQWVGMNATYPMVFSDPEEINSVRELHKKFLKDKTELRDVNVIYKDVPGAVLNIRYKLKNGKWIYRSYSVVDPDDSAVSPEYVTAVKPIEDYLNNPNRIKKHVIGNIWDNCTVTDMSFSSYYWDEAISDFSTNYESFDYLSEREKQDKFGRVYKAVLKDIDEGKIFTTDFGSADYYGPESDYLYNDFSFTIKNTSTEYFSDEDTFWGYDYYDPRYEQSIFARLTFDCTNTLKALKDEGFYSDDAGLLTSREYNKRMGYDNESDGPITIYNN